MTLRKKTSEKKLTSGCKPLTISNYKTFKTCLQNSCLTQGINLMIQVPGIYQ